MCRGQTSIIANPWPWENVIRRRFPGDMSRSWAVAAVYGMSENGAGEGRTKRHLKIRT